MLRRPPEMLACATAQVPTGVHLASVGVDGTNLSIRSDREIFGQTRLSPSGTQSRHELLVVPIERDEDGAPVVGARANLPIRRFGPSHVGTPYAVSPDGRRVYFPDAGDPAGPRESGFVPDWSGLVR